jgi:two-component system LytT family sensor kinase
MKENKHRALWKTVMEHAACWLLYIAYELTVTYAMSAAISISTLYFYACNIALFYAHVSILNRNLGRPEPAYISAIISSLTVLVLTMPLKAFGDYLFYPDKEQLLHDHKLIQSFLVMDFARGVFYIGLASLYWYRGNVAEFRKQSAEAAIRELAIAKEKAEIETAFANIRNAYLQQQLNPHLIFNTLNFIYNRVYKISEDAGRAVLLLSDILSFSLKNTDGNGMVLLQDEADQIDNLISINRYRFHYPLKIEFTIKGNTGKYRMLPLILLTLVENMFKHGDFRNDAASITLNISNDGLLQFSTVNTTNLVTQGYQSNGIGIRNIRLRLDYTYPGKYTMEVTEAGNQFKTALNIHL